MAVFQRCIVAHLLFFHLFEACVPLKTYNTLEEYSIHEPNETPAYQVLMEEEASTNGAYCLDGSVPDFYYRPGVGDGVSKFHIHVYLEGGGWCFGLDMCAARTATSLGSTKFDKPYSNPSLGAPYLSSNRNINPLTFNWNAIYIRYCDGGSYANNNQTLTVYNSTTVLHFRGWRILNGVLNVLRDKYNLSVATDVLFSGCSAGALGVMFHVDYVYERILEFKNNASFNYMAMPDAGYFMEVNGYIASMQFNWNYGNVSSGLHQKCVQYYKQRKWDITGCMYSFNIAPFIEVKMFSTQSQYDSNQIAVSGSKTNQSINAYARNLTTYYIDNYINTSTKHYGFLVSCNQHCNFGVSTWNDIVIDGYTVSQAQVNTWFENTTYHNLLFQNKTYPCGSCC
eukprot:406796_1